ncbi:MAG TPA: DNA polymerase III subunit gamma/tau [Stellaceae bacterium]|nr:DNA polymerase III subunit gamma/tau [Stellaceae bacterium]
MPDTATPYRVLARKYRPQTFAELIGQEAMVRTLANAIASGRVAHAFILTGVRGVGKTTTARIIARALNCVGADGAGGPTVSPCGICEHCRSITEDRHVDVIEMDAASRTGVDDVREIIEATRFRPLQARTKVFVVDEVHMLSRNAFNALLKTLEEPPPDVKFVFATTEIQKVPITVLSRCQRFSLRRVPIDQLTAHYQSVAKAEGVEIEPGALGLIARAADGSVRDGLSILDQAIALANGPVSEAAVRDMLGIADRNLVFDLFETVLKGDAAGALDQMDALYQGGADPLTVVQDLLDLSHFVTRLKLVPDAGAEDPMEVGDRERARPLAAQLSMPVLARAWQMLLKGIEEVQTAPSPKQAAEMLLVRLAYAANLPVPADLVKALANGEAIATQTVSAPPAPTRPPAVMPAPVAAADMVGFEAAPATRAISPAAVAPRASGSAAPAMIASEPAELPSVRVPAADPALDPMPQSFAEVLSLFEKHGEVITRAQLRSQVHLVAFEPGRIEFRPADAAPRDLSNRLIQRLGEWTGARWAVVVSQAEGAPTLEQQEQSRDSEMKSQVAQHPLVRAVLEAFPGATIAAVRERFAAGDPAAEEDEMTADPGGDDDSDDGPGPSEEDEL